jgi:fructokinase
MNPKKGKGPKPRVICFGEVLWDSLPAGLFLGGAPLNVAAHLALLGADPAIVSCVGTDYLGDEAIRRARDMGVDTRFVALDTELPTGTVAARLDARGNATYSFGERVAWDQIPTAAGLEEAVAGAQALVFGTLALRKPANRELLERLLRSPGR